MKIKKMTATFGALHQAVLEPGPGLNIFPAPNETGKSTWAAFLTAMLYGIDTRERTRPGHLAAKHRYHPWSGAPMEGELRVDWRGQDITLRRFPGKSGPFTGFEAVYTATGDPVPQLTAANVGEALTGGGRELFIRSALVGENAAVINTAPELESRISALATTGEEDVSFTQTARTLKNWANRRRSNRANGLIPQLEGEISSIGRALADIEDKRLCLERAQTHVPRLEEERRQLQNDLDIHRRLEQRELNRRYGEALRELADAEEELNRLPSPDPAFDGRTPREARELAHELEEEARQRAAERRRLEEERGAMGALRRRRALIKALFKAAVILMGVGGLAMVIAGFVLRRYLISYIGFGCMLATVALSIPFVLLLGGTDKKLAQLAAMTPPPEPDPVPDVDDYLRLLARRELLEQQALHCRRRVEDWKSRGARELDTLELLHPPALSREETAARLTRVEGELAARREEIQHLRGALIQMGNPLVLESRRAELEEQLARRRAELDALQLAMDILERANQTLRERFSPALNGETGRLFAALTGGKYPQVTLSRDLSAQTAEGEGLLPRSALFLSNGTLDQLYLALRLALCRLTLPDAPLLLDDALAAFDDVRAERALELLRELGEQRQILLFTCHSREARWAGEHGVPVQPL